MHGYINWTSAEQQIHRVMSRTLASLSILVISQPLATPLFVHTLITTYYITLFAFDKTMKNIPVL